MNLAFAIFRYFPFGGAQRDLARVALECVRRGHQVRVYTLAWEGPLLEGVQVEVLSVGGWTRLQRYRRFARAVQTRVATEPTDAVVGFNLMPGLDLCFAADVCFVERAHTQRRPYYRYTPRYRHFSTFEAAVFGPDSDTRILLLSTLQQASYLRHYPASASRVSLLPPGIDRDRVPGPDAVAVREQVRRELGLAEDALLILQVGSGFRIKGVDRSLKAVAALPRGLRDRVTYLLIGQDAAGPYWRLARRLGIGDRCRILPGRNDIPRFLLGADLLLHPAYSESAGYTLLEAVIAGLPVLTTASCGYASHVQSADAGRVCAEPFTQSALDALLAEMLSSDERARWSHNGRRYGERPELYQLATTAADVLEQDIRQREMTTRAAAAT